jgi:hypothetical protein
MDYRPVPLEAQITPFSSDDRRPLKRPRDAYRQCSTPHKFCDILPQPTHALLPTVTDAASVASRPSSPPNPSHTPLTIESSTRRRISLETTKNAFGLYRRYFSRKFPIHDPENEADISNLSNIVDSDTPNPVKSCYSPYPNESSFRLGEWYWNHGVTKSKSSFKELIGVVVDDGFRPLDVKLANWDKIDEHLAGEISDKYEWLDKDAGWRTSSVKISVPFHRFALQPGPQDYVVANFHHRSLVSVIREKLTNQNDARFFHYEPYELLWQRKGAPNSIRVHGEIFTSPAFLDAHKSLQELPGEPGCSLPRVVVAVMFWSDSTHLTSFGNAKLWPLYVFFGNESKYRRAKPSLNLCEHLAYLETVRSALCTLLSSITMHSAACIFQRFCHVICRQQKTQIGIYGALSS